jgi:dipeptidyl aminopeptidase/acylaminoacyl peptidase
MVKLFGTPEESPELWATLSANDFLDRLSGPLELHHGTADSTVPIEFSRTLVEQAGAAGREVELFEYAGDDHNLSANLGVALRRSVAFFDEHLKGP